MHAKKKPSNKGQKQLTSASRVRQSTQQRTPERAKASTQAKSNNTPQVARHTATLSYTSATSTLAQRREAVIDDVGAGDEIPVLELLDAVLPLDRSLSVTKVWSVVKSHADIVSKDSWKAFHPPPSQQKAVEEEVFKPLKDVFKCITTAAGNAYLKDVQFDVHGHRIPSSDWPNQTRPDGSIHLKESSIPCKRQGGIIDHADICCYMEFKKQDNTKNRKDNACKVVYNAHHRFRCDPRCRHVFGLTIEDTSTRFWYFSRATVAVSETFDFVKEPLVLVQLFLAFACSSVETLGFDTTIRCVGFTEPLLPSERHDDEGSVGSADPDPNGDQEAPLAIRRPRRRVTKGQPDSRNQPSNPKAGVPSQQLSPDQVISSRIYEFTIHVDEGDDLHKGSVRKFRTRCCIANYGAVGIRSRGTRVFEVTEVNNSDLIYVLKDVWIDDDRTAEGKTLLEIRSHLEQNQPEVLQHFLDVECHGVVLIDGERDVTSSIPPKSNSRWGQFDFKTAFSEVGQKRGHDGQMKGLIGNWNAHKGDESSTKRIIGRRGDPRKHYRIVFKGPPGIPISQLSIDEAFVALQGGTKAMQAMYQMGYIHRDLSCGNILLTKGKEGPTGVLIDLEYASRFPRDDTKIHDYRTGTREFMANEVQTQSFQKASRRNQYKPAWFHHPIHDVESIWWIALWTFYFLQDSPIEQRQALFPELDVGLRPTIWASEAEYERLCSQPPETIQDILYDWLLFITGEYTSLAAKFDINGTYQSFDYNNVCEESIGFVEKIRIALQNIRDNETPYEEDNIEELAESNETNHRRKRVKTEDSSST